MTEVGEPSNAVPDESSELPKLPSISIRASLFFDGTLNNRTNVAVGPEGAAWLANLGSYDNDYSNISKLESFFESSADADVFFSLYIEGIGTINGGGDIPQGMAMGQGLAGITAKVKRGMKHLIAVILALSYRRISHIYLDSFGFSRGAAAARYFIFWALKKEGKSLKEQLADKGCSVERVEMKFVGLFDTVASHGFSFTDDTPELELTAVQYAERVVQLAAAEEHREKFPLTNINSAANGREIFLPGVHSDVGGGYNHNADEEDLQILDLSAPLGLSDEQEAAFAREREWLITLGWYTAAEIEGPNWRKELKANRSGISNRYSRIPLHLMSRLAGEGGVTFSNRMRTVYEVPVMLESVEAFINHRVDGGSNFSVGDWFNNSSPMMQTLRHGFLHFSSYYNGIGVSKPRWSNGDPVTGKRERDIIEG